MLARTRKFLQERPIRTGLIASFFFALVLQRTADRIAGMVEDVAASGANNVLTWFFDGVVGLAAQATEYDWITFALPFVFLVLALSCAGLGVAIFGLRRLGDSKKTKDQDGPIKAASRRHVFWAYLLLAAMILLAGGMGVRIFLAYSLRASFVREIPIVDAVADPAEVRTLKARWATMKSVRDWAAINDAVKKHVVEFERRRAELKQ